MLDLRYSEFNVLARLRLRHKKRRSAHNAKQRSRVLWIEPLEDRRLLATGLFERLESVLGAPRDISADTYASGVAVVGTVDDSDVDDGNLNDDENLAVSDAQVAVELTDSGSSAKYSAIALARGSIAPFLQPPTPISSPVVQLDFATSLGAAAGSIAGGRTFTRSGPHDPYAKLDGRGRFQYHDHDLNTPVDLFYGSINIVSAGIGSAGGDNAYWAFEDEVGITVTLGGSQIAFARISGFGSGTTDNPGVRQFDISAFGASVDGPGESFVVNDVSGVNLLINFSAFVSEGQQLRIDVEDDPFDPFDPEGIWSSLDVEANADDSRVSASLVNSVSIFGQAQDLADPPPGWHGGEDGIGNNPPPDYGGTDEDGDGDSDGDDHALWFAKQLAPKITNVSLGGPNPFDGTNGFYAVPSGNGEQIRTVPVGGADLVKIKFNRPMDEATLVNALSLTGAYTSTNYTSGVVFQDYDPFTFTATWEYSPTTALPADQMVLGLADTAKDFAGQQLDGEWTNPYSLTDIGTSTFPSGDGFEGGAFELFITVLPGDSDRDNIVSGTDFLRWQIHQSPTATDNNFEESDFDGDTDVDGNDLAQWEANYGLAFTTFSGVIADRIASPSLGFSNMAIALIEDVLATKSDYRPADWSALLSREIGGIRAEMRGGSRDEYTDGRPIIVEGGEFESDFPAIDQGALLLKQYGEAIQRWPVLRPRSSGSEGDLSEALFTKDFAFADIGRPQFEDQGHISPFKISVA